MHSRKASDSSSTDSKERLRKRRPSSLFCSESSTGESSGHGDPAAKSSPQAEKDNKRTREEELQLPQKRHSRPKMTVKKPSPPLSKVAAEEKKSSGNKDRRNPCRQEVDPTVTVSAQQQDEKNKLNELRADCIKAIEAAEARTAAFVEQQFKSASESLQRRNYGGSRVGLDFSITNKELMDAICAASDFPLLDGAKAETLEQKWRELSVVDKEVFSRRLNLLKKECKMCLKALKSPTASELKVDGASRELW